MDITINNELIHTIAEIAECMWIAWVIIMIYILMKRTKTIKRSADNS